jgi:RNA polymerase sigma factor (sigma-70 family)
MHSEDKELIERILEGDSEALQTVRKWILAAAGSFRQLASQTEDVLQESFKKVISSLQQGAFRGEGGARLKAFVQQIARHTCLDFCPNPGVSLLNTDEINEKFGKLELPGRSPLERAADIELLLRVQAAVPRGCWELFLMIAAGLSRWEMSQLLNISEEAVRRRVCDCRKKAKELRDRLEGKK